MIVRDDVIVIEHDHIREDEEVTRSPRLIQSADHYPFEFVCLENRQTLARDRGEKIDRSID